MQGTRLTALDVGSQKEKFTPTCVSAFTVSQICPVNNTPLTTDD